MATTKKADDNQCGEHVDKMKPARTTEPLWKTIGQFFHNPAILLLETQSREMKAYVYTETCM